MTDALVLREGGAPQRHRHHGSIVRLLMLRRADASSSVRTGSSASWTRFTEQQTAPRDGSPC